MKNIVVGISVLLTVTQLPMHAEPTGKPDYSALIEKYTRLFEAEMGKLKITGMSVALTDENQMVWSRGFGSEDLANNKQASSRTIYGIGSMTKVFTAAAVMQLQEHKGIDIDKPLRAYLPAFKIKSSFGSPDLITPRGVLTHHSGLPADLMTTPADRDFRAYIDETPNQESAFPPGYIECYSNFGYGLLGSLIEAGSKEQYETYVQNHFLRPLGMNDAWVASMSDPLQGASKAYDDAGKEQIERPCSNIPAGGVYASVDDMARFLRLWLNAGRGPSNQVLKAETVSEMFRVQNRDVVLDLGKVRGICWDSEHGDAGWLYSHGGALIYFRSQMAVAPDAGLGVVILVNSASGGGITWRCKELLKEAARIKGLKPANARIKMAPPVKPNLTPLAADAIPGRYANDFMQMKIEAVGSNFLARISDNQLRLTPSGINQYSMQYKDGEDWKSIPDETYYFSQVKGLNLWIQEKWGTLNVAAVQVNPATADSKWAQRAGKYRVIAPQKPDWFIETELVLQEGVPVFTTPLTNIGQTAPFHMQIEDDSRARVMGLGRYSGNVAEFRTQPGKDEVLRFMGLELRKIN